MKKRVYFVSSFWATIFFEIAKNAFTYYVTNVANYSKIYGNIAFIIVTALWLYIVSVIFILAAIIGQIYREKHDLMMTKNREGIFN
jgi:membrane protein